MIYGEASYEASYRVSKMVYKNHVGAEIQKEYPENQNIQQDTQKPP